MAEMGDEQDVESKRRACSEVCSGSEHTEQGISDCVATSGDMEVDGGELEAGSEAAAGEEAEREREGSKSTTSVTPTAVSQLQEGQDAKARTGSKSTSMKESTKTHGEGQAVERDVVMSAARECKKSELAIGRGSKDSVSKKPKARETFKALEGDVPINQEALVVACFADVYDSLVWGIKRHKADKDYPTVNDEESAELLNLYRRFKQSKKTTFEAWQGLLTEIARALHNSSWSLTQIVRSYDRIRLGGETALNAWSPAAAAQRSSAAAPLHAAKENNRDADVTCDGERYSTKEREEIVNYCRRSFKASVERRQPTELEWTILEGMLEGTVVTKSLPQFLRRISTGESLVRFQLTIQAQVEGHLTGRLNDNTPVYANHQSTRRLVEAITQAARQRQEPAEPLYDMLAAVKRVEYHAGSHSINLYFYTRKEASKWAGMKVPFRRQIIQLADVHEKRQRGADGTAESVWDRQKGIDGCVDVDSRFRYRVQLLNMNSFMGVAAFLKALETKIGESFLAYSLDRGGPTSQYSQHWELEFQSSVCPAALTGVQRLYWVEHQVLVHHVSTHKQPPCLVCGSSLHFLRNCSTPTEDMKIKNCIVFGHEEASKTATTPATFTTIDEMKAAFEIVETDTKQPDTSVANDNCDKSNTVKTNTVKTNGDTRSGNHRMSDKSGDPVKQTRKKSQRRRNKPSANAKSEGTAKNPIEIDSDSADDAGEAAPENPKPKAARPPVTKEAIKWAKELQRVRKVVQGSRAKHAHVPDSPGADVDDIMDYNATPTMLEVANAIGVRPGATPTNGNCQFHALAEAALQRSFADEDAVRALVDLTATIKNGVRAAGNVAFEAEFSPTTRQSLLENVHRLTEGMTKEETADAVREYLDDIANGPSDPNEAVELTHWGGAETLGLAVVALEAPVYLVRQGKNGALFAQYNVRRLPTHTTSTEVFPDAADWVTQVKKATAEAAQKGTPMPVVLAYEGRHYTSLLFGQGHSSKETPRLTSLQKALQKAGALQTFAGEEQRSMQARRDIEGQFEVETDEESENLECAEELDSDSNDSASDEDVNMEEESPSTDFEEAESQTDDRHRADAKTCDNSIQYQRNKDSDDDEESQDSNSEFNSESDNEEDEIVIGGRYRMPSAAIVDVAVLDIENQRAVAALAERYRTSPDTVLRWQEAMLRDQYVEPDSSIQDLEEDSEWSPPPSTQDQGLGREEKQNQESKVGSTVSDKQRLRSNRDSTVAKRRQQEAEAERHWNAHHEDWTLQSKTAFPKSTSLPSTWMKAAHEAGPLLLQWIRHSPAPQYILNCLREPTIIELARRMREELLQSELKRVRDSTDDTTLRRQTGAWLERCRLTADPLLRSAMWNNADEWAELRRREFGKNATLIQCSPRKKVDLSRSLIGAFVYQDEMATRAGAAIQDDRSVVDVLAIAREVTKADKTLATTFKSMVTEGNWSALESALEQIEEPEAEEYGTEY